jgi:hypothetical protein
MSNKKLIISSIVAIVMIVSAALVALNIIKSSGGRITDPEPAIVDESKKEQDAKTAAEKIKIYNDTLITDTKKMVAALKTFQKANNGRIPVDWNIYYDVYLDLELIDKYDFALCDMASGTCPDMTKLNWNDDGGVVYVAKHSFCRSENIIFSNSSKKVSFITTRKTEDGRSGGNVCANN